MDNGRFTILVIAIVICFVTTGVTIYNTVTEIYKCPQTQEEVK